MYHNWITFSQVSSKNSQYKCAQWNWMLQMYVTRSTYLIYQTNKETIDASQMRPPKSPSVDYNGPIGP
jgi:UDP-N-acetylglucosamine pyrophosphorylase